jgi:molybdenum cofactor synthesis domain-containing protein
MMQPLGEVQAAVLAIAESLPVVEVPANDALGLVLAEEIVAEGDVPSFANSAMDGFAVRAADASSRRIVGRIGAGVSAETASVGEGEAVRIMTGAPMPAGADAVVMVERTTEHDGVIDVDGDVRVGDNIRWPGEDVRKGDVLLTPGLVLNALRLGVVASAGYATVRVHRRPVVGVLSTGDELVSPGAPLEPPQIRDSNRPMVLGLVASSGATAVDLGNVGDDPARLDAALADACARCDLVLTTGGVSMGDADLMKQRLTAVQVAIKPSKPLAYGVLHDTPVIGLPGNPVSAAVSFTLFAKPLIRKLAGASDDAPTSVQLAAGVTRKPDGKTHLVRVRVADGVATPVLGQASHQLTATASADGFVAIPDGDGAAAGDVVPFTGW